MWAAPLDRSEHDAVSMVRTLSLVCVALKAPTLALYGAEDGQTPAEPNLAVLASEIHGRDPALQSRSLPKLDSVVLPETGRTAELFL